MDVSDGQNPSGAESASAFEQALNTGKRALGGGTSLLTAHAIETGLLKAWPTPVGKAVAVIVPYIGIPLVKDWLLKKTAYASPDEDGRYSPDPLIDPAASVVRWSLVSPILNTLTRNASLIAQSAASLAATFWTGAVKEITVEKSIKNAQRDALPDDPEPPKQPTAVQSTQANALAATIRTPVEIVRQIAQTVVKNPPAQLLGSPYAGAAAAATGWISSVIASKIATEDPAPPGPARTRSDVADKPRPASNPLQTLQTIMQADSSSLAATLPTIITKNEAKNLQLAPVVSLPAGALSLVQPSGTSIYSGDIMKVASTSAKNQQPRPPIARTPTHSSSERAL